VDKERVRLFHGPHMGTPAPYMVLLRLLERTDWFIQDRASRVLCRLLACRPDRGRPLGLAAAGGSAAEHGAAVAPATPPPPGSAGAACLSFLDWAVRTLRSPGDPRCVAPATAALACLACERELRPVAFRQGALGLLAPTLRSAGAGPHNVQLLYDAGLAVWLLTFYPPAAEGTLASGALAGLIETARGASKEKVVRVALQALRNLLDCQEAPGARAAVQAAAGRLAATLRLRAFHDEDLNEALDALESLGAAGSGHGASQQGSWERYRQEVLSGALDWGGARGDDSFWRDHVPQLEEGNHALVKQLCTVLQAPSTPPRALAVACHDLGHIATAVPRGRAVIAETGAKAALLRLMTHDEEDVRKQALLATQKLLVVGWQYLG
jgi:V-type H+-transporting ATPase subunit H